LRLAELKYENGNIEQSKQ